MITGSHTEIFIGVFSVVVQILIFFELRRFRK